MSAKLGQTLGALALLCGVFLAAGPEPAVATEPVDHAAEVDAALALWAAGGEGEDSALQERANRALSRGVDAVLLSEALKRARAAGWSAAEAGRMVDRARGLEEQGLPAEPVLDRMLQGMAKGVPYSRIEAVADRLGGNLRRSAHLLDAALPAAPDGEPVRREMIRHGAYALGAGADEAVMAAALQLAQEADDPLRAARSPVLALGSLCAAGLPPRRSLDVVGTAWREGYQDRDLERLSQALSAFGGPDSPPPADVVDGVLHRMRAGTPRGDLFRHLDEMLGAHGHHPPGAGPGEDPGHMRGPGGPPEDPGHQGPHGHGPHHNGG
ncbi:MAG: hypothetical protein GF355_12110 [Candidatus Eisenbacteria bacterium]|nr:hypothetical protein [Candidatus Eisenbacteria bacterium]